MFTQKLSNSDKTSWKENKKSLKRAACMVSTLGLPWIFGYLMLLSTDPDAKRVFSVLFSLINSLQVCKKTNKILLHIACLN